MTKRGHLVDWATQRWVRLTGRSISLPEHAWLEGPIGKPGGIGASFFETYAAEHALRPAQTGPNGLLPDLNVLQSPAFDPRRVAANVAAFYTHTSEHELDAWSEWQGPFRPFGSLLAAMFSRRLQQLNVPLSNLDTSRGMTSEVVALVDSATGRRAFATWVRRLVGTGNVIYVGAYSTCVVPEHATPCLRVVFPLPNGNAMVLMRPSVQEDGSLLLVSAGAGFGSPGFYFTIRDGSGALRARYLRALRESIHIYQASDDIRADHVLSLFGFTFLRFHYRLRRAS